MSGPEPANTGKATEVVTANSLQDMVAGKANKESPHLTDEPTPPLDVGAISQIDAATERAARPRYAYETVRLEEIEKPDDFVPDQGTVAWMIAQVRAKRSGPAVVLWKRSGGRLVIVDGRHRILVGVALGYACVLAVVLHDVPEKVVLDFRTSVRLQEMADVLFGGEWPSREWKDAASGTFEVGGASTEHGKRREERAKKKAERKRKKQ